MRRPVIALATLGLTASAVLITVPTAQAAPVGLRTRLACSLEGYQNVLECAAEPHGGTGPYAYSWNGDASGEYNTQFSDECTGTSVTESVTITDATGATVTRRTTLRCAAPAPGPTSKPLKARAACIDTPLDQWGGYVICATQPSGGTAPYTVDWTAATKQGVYDDQALTIPDFFCAGGKATFVMTVTDAAGATVTSTDKLLCADAV
ncbi:hypothetical protein [Streptantibioticus silvisoli]|jgi:hypothetical protein|uniref:Ig-like domain-containing protein n=1 Tax=Streptantibioticus silvisoli TaxID=2705255 RepID=A0ABT6VS99_9ACTN|nr:hypothetical protein [Streptantibioticus silvisoli]MDI5961364.1 hypothetical protein [Streptantibioticus silvisoli]